MQKNTELYKNHLQNVFNHIKQMIIKNERVPIIDSTREYKHNEITVLRPNEKNVEIYSISPSMYRNSYYIHLSGVNIMFYLVCLYMRDVLNKNGTYCEEKTQKLKILKSSNFIFEEDDNGFWYYPIAEIKEIGDKEGFLFDLPKLPTTVDIENKRKKYKQ